MIERYDAEVVGGTHGVTCVFPTLRSVIDYEEKKKVPNQGYPRFITHPFVVSVQNRHKRDGQEVIAVQSPEAAEFVHLNYFDDDTRNHSGVESHNDSGNKYGLIYVGQEHAQCARDSVTNAGVVLNSRKAQRILENREPPKQSESLPRTLSDLEKGSSPGLTFIYTSGMAAVYDVVSGFLERGTSAAVVGNTYVDSGKIFRKLPERFPYKPTTFHTSDGQISLPDFTSLVFLEIPTNPLLKVANLESIVRAAHNKGAVVIVDSTIASPYHFSPFEFGADIIVHSTTKSLSGKNNHMGGVLFVNPRSPSLVKKIRHSLFVIDEEESLILEENLKSFPDRIKRMANNAEEVAEYLLHNKNISRVYYPEGLKNGGGHVISFELKGDDFRIAELFYDNCTLPTKGPSMGYERTMLMPYTLITHFSDSDGDVAKIGLKRYLMRLSVGTESADEIIGHLSRGIRVLG